MQPAEAFFADAMGEFMLKYEDVQKSENPGEMLLQFLESTYEAAAETGKWKREALEIDLTGFEKSTR